MRDAHAINFRWLLALRWGAMAGQSLTIAVVLLGMGMPLPLAPLALIVAVEVVTNLAATAWAASRREVPEAALAAVMLLDVALLTALLALTGGPFNPFSCLYLVNIALAAVVLRPRWTWTLVTVSLACFGMLFAQPRWGAEAMPGALGHEAHFRMHLEGMWVAFGVAAVFIVYFVQRVTRALATRDAELAAAQVRTARHERLAALATLAAGAAHELATPLSTIAVVAKELERQLAAGRSGSDARDDARLIREQVERCRAILELMAADAGASAGEAIVAVALADIAAAAIEACDGMGRVHVAQDDELRSAMVHAPRRALVRALCGLIENAIQASRPDGTVEVHVRHGEGTWRLAVCDHGSGMAPEILARAGEPFFTTKGPGGGMGLGLFLARETVERLGGSLDLASTAGRGTTVEMILPASGAISGASGCDNLPRGDVVSEHLAWRDAQGRVHG
jgi:two-component system sensor histidine kinase RegB